MGFWEGAAFRPKPARGAGDRRYQVRCPVFGARAADWPEPITPPWSFWARISSESALISLLCVLL